MNEFGGWLPERQTFKAVQVGGPLGAYLPRKLQWPQSIDIRKPFSFRQAVPGSWCRWLNV